jgi:hypothetical protein
MMKTLYIKSIPIAILFGMSVLSCKKESAPLNIQTQQHPFQANESVIYSEWFSVSWDSTNLAELRQSEISVPQLSSDLLANGRVLIFARGGYENKAPTILPTSIDDNFITVNAQPSYIKFMMEGTRSVSKSRLRLL